MAQRFGPPNRGGLPEAPLYKKVQVAPGQRLADVAAAHATSAHEIATASELPHFHVAPGQSVVIPGPRLRVEPAFQKAAQYYQTEFEKFEARVETDTSLNPKTRPAPTTDWLTSEANFGHIITDRGVEKKSNHIELEPHKAQLRVEVEKVLNSAPIFIGLNPPVAARRPTGDAGASIPLAMRVSPTGMELVPARIELDPARAQAQQDIAQQQTALVHRKGRADELSLTENRWASAFSNNAAALYGALSLGAEGVGDWKTQRWADSRRVRNEHDAALADERAHTQGAVEHSSQIESTADFLNWFGGHAQQWLPQILTFAPGAVLGGVALGTRTAAKIGGVVFSYPHSVGSVARAQREQSGAAGVTSAFLLGVPHAGANYFGLEGGLLSGQFFRSGITALDAAGVGGIPLRMAVSGAKVAPVQAGTEGFQTLVERGGQLAVDPIQPFFNRTVWGNLKEALYAGGALGFAGGAGLGGWRRSTGVKEPNGVQLHGGHWQKVGRQLGSTPGGRYVDPNTGIQYYVKFPDKNNPQAPRARLEVLAVKLYEAAGLGMPAVELVSIKGKIGVASRWVDGVSPLPSLEVLADLGKSPWSDIHNGFALDAWLGRLDALNPQNTKFINGQAMRIEAGDSFEFPRTTHVVSELDGMRTIYGDGVHDQKPIFYGMTDEEVGHSINRVLALMPEEVRTLVDAYGPMDVPQRQSLLDLLLGRQDYLRLWQEDRAPHTMQDRPEGRLHPQRGKNGEPFFLHAPTRPGDAKRFSNSRAVATFTPYDIDLPLVLNGMPLNAWKPPQTLEGWNAVEGQNSLLDIGFPPFTEGPIPTAAGVIIEEPDGRVWLMKSSNGFADAHTSFPKGRQDPGLSLQATAIKEAYEETGLKVKLVGVMEKDFQRGPTHIRYYIGRRVGGTPLDMGWESQGLRLVPADQLDLLLPHEYDQQVIEAYHKNQIRRLDRTPEN